jgi:magnesium chelatase family protein
MLLIGPPGAGKSMLAARLPGLLPDLTPREALEVSMVHSVAGMLEEGRLVSRPPFRDPHHSASPAAICGGGPRAKPGEISLAHRGVLFLDELPEFPRGTLETLRQPLETGRAMIARAAAHVAYPARFQLVAAMNPCRCGYLGDTGRECSRAPVCGDHYRARLSGPLLDRLDLVIEVMPVSAHDLAYAPAGEASAPVAARVAAARGRQRARHRGAEIATNAEAPADSVELRGEARAFLERAAGRLDLSPRGFTRALRVGRTIADLAGSELVEQSHVAEALHYRNRNYGKLYAASFARDGVAV